MRHQVMAFTALLTLTTCDNEDPCVDQIRQDTATLAVASDEVLVSMAGELSIPAGSDVVPYFKPYMANALLCERGHVEYCGDYFGARDALGALAVCLYR